MYTDGYQLNEISQDAETYFEWIIIYHIYKEFQYRK